MPDRGTIGRRRGDGVWGRVKRLARYQYLRLMRLRASPHNIALGLALGIFVGFLPIVPFQSVVVIALAFVLRGSKVAGFLGTWISNPIDLPFFYYGLFLVGRTLLPFEGVHFDPHHLSMAEMLKAGWKLFAVMCVGGVFLGIPSAVVTYFVTRRTVKAYRRRKSRRLLARRAARLETREVPTRRMLPWSRVAADNEAWEALRLSPRRVLVLDFDGTLSPFVDDPAQARPYPGVRQRLEAIMSRPGCRVVFVTGRAAEDLSGLLGLESAPEIWGSHGGERLLPSGDKVAMPMGDARRQGLEQAEAWASDSGLADRLERKPGCLAFHLRGLDSGRASDLERRVRERWASLAAGTGLALHDFDGGLELRVPGFDKGLAVRAVLEEEGPGAVVFYLGDDLTDEDAFAALGDRGVGVLVRARARESRAHWHLVPPRELLEFLDAWLDAC